MITAFTKIFTIGTDYIRDIFNEDVEVSEKIDGSQLCFGKVGGELHIRSKGAQLYIANPEKMFAQAIDYIEQIQDRLPEGIVFYSEYMNKPKHNTLKYERVPKNNIMLFGVMHISQRFELNIADYADMLDIECVPIIHVGKIGDISELMNFMDRQSVLGGTKIEGIVVKNYSRKFLLGGTPMPLMAGKYVSETFKEVHRERWGKEEKTKGRLETFMESFRTEARWEKAIQHLQERGEIENEPRDIGKLIKEIHVDIEAEEIDAIKEFLYKEFKNELRRKASAGVAEWYKKRLAEEAFVEKL